MKNFIKILIAICLTAFIVSCASLKNTEKDNTSTLFKAKHKCPCSHKMHHKMHKMVTQFNPPRIHLVSFMVPQYDGFWYYSKKVKPTKGSPGDRGAPLPMNFVFEVANPNPYPVMLKGFRFTVDFEGFDLITIKDNNSYWLPAKKIDHIQVSTMITVRSALLSLLVTGGFKLKQKGLSPWQALERWWEKIPLLEIPVIVKDGTANFIVDETNNVVSFSDFYPKE